MIQIAGRSHHADTQGITVQGYRSLQWSILAIPLQAGHIGTPRITSNLSQSPFPPLRTITGIVQTNRLELLQRDIARLAHSQRRRVRRALSILLVVNKHCVASADVTSTHEQMARLVVVLRCIRGQRMGTRLTSRHVGSRIRAVIVNLPPSAPSPTHHLQEDALGVQRVFVRSDAVQIHEWLELFLVDRATRLEVVSRILKDRA
jgi:hypothetical protein